MSFFYSLVVRADNQQVIISFNNQIFTTEYLKNNHTIMIDSLVVIEIDDNKARISFSTCKNQQCVNKGWSNNLPIICVPNRIMLDFKKNNRNKRDELFITY